MKTIASIALFLAAGFVLALPESIASPRMSAVAVQQTSRQTARSRSSRRHRAPKKHVRRAATIDLEAEASGFERAQMGGKKETSGPRSFKAVIDGDQDAGVKFGSPRPGKFERSGASFDGDLRNLPMEAPERMERPEREDPIVRPGVAKLPAGSAAAEAAPQTQPESLVDSLLAAAPAPIITYDGLDFANFGAGHPPDTNGDVGPTYYIQTVNTSLGIYNKSTGARVAAFGFNTFMSQGHFGNLCDTNNFGDPVVVYDTFEDRWIITDFAFALDGAGNVTPQVVLQCIAASKTGDPVSGGWNYYSITAPGGLADYPKFGIWPDGLYMSANMFGYASGGAYFGYHVWAINKAQMYAGAPSVQYVDFAGDTSDFTVIPSNARLQAGAPPAGSPEYFISTEQFLNALSIYKFHVDWNKVSTSTFTGPFTQLAPNCWPNATPANAATTANAADVLALRAMVQAQYTNIGGAESIWLAHTVQRGVSATNSTCNATTGGFATVRWYQANVTGGTIAANVAQGQSFDPEAANTFYRFMPSVAVDRSGDMAMGYTKSNSTTNPQMKYAGRLVGDPVNTITQTEQTLIDGTGSQSGNCGTSACTRWGDYSAMTLDPDGCTFWYTNEYYATSGLNDLTRIGSFKYPSCNVVGNGTISGTVTTNPGGAPIVGATVALGSRTTTTNGSGNYSFTIPAGTYAGETASFPGRNSSSSTAIAVPDGGTATQNFSLAAAPAAACPTDTSQSDFQTGIPTNVDLTTSPNDATLTNLPIVDQSNTAGSGTGTGSITNTSWAAQTFTSGVTGPVVKADFTLFCSGCTSNPNFTVSLRATTAGLPTGADLATATVAGDNSGNTTTFTANFGTPATLTSGTQYALIVRTVSAPGGSGYFWIRSSPSTYAGGQRVTSGDSGATWTADSTRDYNFHIYVQTGYNASGDLISAVKDANPAAGQTTTWGAFTWTATTPANTTLQFQVAASNSQFGPFNYVGPGGTNATFYTTSGGSLAQFNGKRYLRYRAFFATTNGAVTPTLNDVTTCFTNNIVTAAGVMIAGRVMTADGSGVRGAIVSITDDHGIQRNAITNSFGYYTFDNVQSGQNYVMRAAARRFTFGTKLLTVNDALTDVNFVDGQ